ncbi:aldehyde dehydrogenase family protein [Brachybacterium sp. GPGPB12]|uniref:aldehyde dehydrogenase family protein n=1 Tax=Brachybacterium sp. GPGPB12 TaxID=3023517 RepID=UPI003134350A
MTESPATLFIDGAWVPSSTGETRTITCPADGTEVGVVSEAGAEDVERAILAARAAFERGEWSGTPAARRGDFLFARRGPPG